MINDVTAHKLLPLPNQGNTLLEDVERLRDAITGIDSDLHANDTAIAAANTAIAANTTALASKADLVGGKIPAGQLPSYVDDVLEYANLAAFPGTGETGKVYLALDTNKAYRWSGSAYVILSDYTLPTASAGTLGGIKIGSGLSIDGAGVVSIAGGAGSQAFTETTITPTAGQTVFTIAGGYIAGQIELFLNGVLLIGGGDDYTASNGSTIILTTGAAITDTLLLRKWQAFSSVLLGTAAAKDVPASGDAAAGQVVLGNDTRISPATTVKAGTLSAADKAKIDASTLSVVAVTGTTVTATAGNQYILKNVAATAVDMTAALVADQLFQVTPANGLKTNTINLGTNTVIGPAANVTGILTLDSGKSITLRAISTNQLVVM